jgi:pyridoxine 5-phosphate synthase
MKRGIKLGVNIDHVATLRQARREGFPDLIAAASAAIAGGADSIVAHLREDRRHIQDSDIYSIRKLKTHFDLEMAATDEMLKIALNVKPDMVTIVPEKREELTTEGGLDVSGNLSRLREFAKRLEDSGIRVSLFVDPLEDQIRASSETGASFIEIHTGKYARSGSKKDLSDIAASVILAKSLGLRVNAGHGLDYGNAASVARIDGMEELNIGFSIIARSIFVGLKKAASDMKKLLMLFAVFGVLCSCSYSAVVVPPTVEAIPGWIDKLVATEEAAPEKPIFVDVPPEHWAANSVARLFKMGVTQGYPDGTFRGENNITRYETAVFLSKMAYEMQVKAAADEKLAEELKAETYKLRYTLDMYRKPLEKRPISASFYARTILGNIVSANSASSIINAPLGPVFDWRLKASYRQELGGSGPASPIGGFVRIGMDTMDSARNSRDFVKEMLEAEAQFVSKWGLGLNLSSGPGLVIHREGTVNIFPSEDYRAYIRPNNGIKLFYESGDIEGGLGYRATSVSTNGAAAMNDAFAYAGYRFKNTFMGDIRFKYSVDLFNNDLRANFATTESTINMYEMIVEPADKVEVGIKLGASGSVNTPHNVFAAVSLVSKDLFRGGSAIKLFANKIGADFLEFPTYQAITGVNLFDKLYQSGTYDLGMEISQGVSRRLSLKIIADVVTGPTGLYGKDEPKSSATFELDMDYGLSEYAIMTFGFRTHQDPSALTNATSDMLWLGFRYNY